jgi:hypothetical protein
MSTIRNMVALDCYLFNSVNNAFVRKETQMIPLPVTNMIPCAPGPDGKMKVYTKIIFGNPPQERYVGETISQLQSLIVQ